MCGVKLILKYKDNTMKPLEKKLNSQKHWCLLLVGRDISLGMSKTTDITLMPLSLTGHRTSVSESLTGSFIVFGGNSYMVVCVEYLDSKRRFMILSLSNTNKKLLGFLVSSNLSCKTIRKYAARIRKYAHSKSLLV